MPEEKDNTVEEKYREYTLDELLLRRKELSVKVQLRQKLFNTPHIFQENLRRTSARHEGLDDIIGTLPVMDRVQLEHELNYYSQKLREVDEVVQGANFNEEVNGPSSIFVDFSEDMKLTGGTVTKKLASFLTRRKTLNDICRRVDIEDSELIHSVNERLEATEGTEKLKEKYAKKKATEVLARMEHYHTQLRLCDELIHEANCSIRRGASPSLLDDYPVD